jgi:glycosyltransferase involved in cell wall biosynthesis
MISVVVPCLNAQETLPRCFDSLIAATVHGVVREVIVADGGSTDDTLIIADAAGARIAHGGSSRVSQLQAGAACARGDWILFLYPEIALSPGWDVEAGTFMSHVGFAKPFAAAFHFALEEFDPASRRSETYAALRSTLLKLPFGEQGLLIPRTFYDQLGGYREVAMCDADMARRIGAGRLVILRARAVCQTQTRPVAKPRPLLTALYALRLPPKLLAKIN